MPKFHALVDLVASCARARNALNIIWAFWHSVSLYLVHLLKERKANFFSGCLSLSNHSCSEYLENQTPYFLQVSKNLEGGIITIKILPNPSWFPDSTDKFGEIIEKKWNQTLATHTSTKIGIWHWGLVEKVFTLAHGTNRAVVEEVSGRRTPCVTGRVVTQIVWESGNVYSGALCKNKYQHI